MKRTKRRKSDQSAGKGRTRISTTISVETDDELRRLAAVSSLTRTAMARECIEDAVNRGLVITKTKRDSKIYPLEHPENPTARAADGAAV